jgi:hypothetical protein
MGSIGAAGENWPFADPKNTAVISTKQVIFEGQDICFVSHDAEDGAWQFLDGGIPDVVHATVVSLESIVAVDPTLMQLANLPLGWTASRSAKGSGWVCHKP